MTDIDTITSTVVPEGVGGAHQTGAHPRRGGAAPVAKGSIEPGPLARLRRLLDKDPSQGGLGRSARRWTLPARHDVGRLIREVVDEATAGGTLRYDAKVFPRLQEALGLNQSLARKLVRFAQTFSRERAVGLSQTRLVNGAEFSWSHVRRLLEVRDDRQRDQLIERTIRNGWTSERLAKEIQSARGGKKNKGGRRRHQEAGTKAIPAEV
jgi:hypothetical protein